MLARLNIKQCPSCRQAVKRMWGCASMLCRCGAYFCYECNKPSPDCICRRGPPDDQDDPNADVEALENAVRANDAMELDLETVDLDDEDQTEMLVVDTHSTEDQDGVGPGPVGRGTVPQPESSDQTVRENSIVVPNTGEPAKEDFRLDVSEGFAPGHPKAATNSLTGEAQEDSSFTIDPARPVPPGMPPGRSLSFERSGRPNDFAIASGSSSQPHLSGPVEPGDQQTGSDSSRDQTVDTQTVDLDAGMDDR